jgi:hypothetical protein
MIALPTTKQLLAQNKRREQEIEKQKKQPPPTTEELLTNAQKTTGTHYFPALDPRDPSTAPSLAELLAEHRAMVDELAVPFSIYHHDLSKAKPQPVRWLWQNRLPLAGITLLDGDRGTGKSLLALQIAASVSSGSPMPDGTPTIQGGVVIVSPNADATTSQLRLLTALGADLSRVKIISFIREAAPEFHTGGHRPFSLPKDFLPLFLAIKKVDARLVIFDPFITLLSREQRCTNERLCHLLIDLNQRLIERNVACLLIRNCPAKGGHARPSVLERSDHFLITSASRLLLAPDPMQPDRLLLAHVQNRHSALTPTLTLQARRRSLSPEMPSLTLLGCHDLQARDLLEYRPDTLHRRLLSAYLLRVITEANRTLPVATLYALSPNSSPFQIQRALNDLLNMGQIERPARGFYTLATANPVFKPKATTAITSNAQPANKTNGTVATKSNVPPINKLNGTAATTSNIQPANKLNGTAATTSNTQPANKLNGTAATTSNIQPANKLNGTAATTSNIQPANKLNGTVATTFNIQPANKLNGTAATTSNIQPANELNGTAATTPDTQPANPLLKPRPCGAHGPGCQCVM